MPDRLVRHLYHLRTIGFLLVASGTCAGSQQASSPTSPEVNTVTKALGTQQSTTYDHEDYLTGPEDPDQRSGESKYLFGEWRGARERLQQRGVAFELLYISDSLSNVQSVQHTRFTSYSRVRGTVDLDLERLAGARGLTIHMTGAWQTGANLMQYLGTLASPSALATANAFRLDAWWVQKVNRSERVAFRVGQFSGLDSYGSQFLGASFFSQPMSYALTALGNTFETFQPFGTSAAELRVVPYQHVYVKSMVQSGDRLLTQHNLTGFIPQFRGAPVSVSEVGWSPGMSASKLRFASTPENRKGYSGLYQFGAAYNPGHFTPVISGPLVSGNYMLYGIASQAVYRTPGKASRGLDVTAGFSAGPANRNRNDRQITIGARYDELLPIRQQNIFALALVHSTVSPSAGIPPSSPGYENLLEFDATVALRPSIILEPTVQRILNAGGQRRADTILGFRSKVVF